MSTTIATIERPSRDPERVYQASRGTHRGLTLIIVFGKGGQKGCTVAIQLGQSGRVGAIRTLAYRGWTVPPNMWGQVGKECTAISKDIFNEDPTNFPPVIHNGAPVNSYDIRVIDEWIRKYGPEHPDWRKKSKQETIRFGGS